MLKKSVFDFLSKPEVGSSNKIICFSVNKADIFLIFFFVQLKNFYQNQRLEMLHRSTFFWKNHR